MTYLNYVILYCFMQINGERSIYSVFHILKGKKSSQSIQDAHLFYLHPFFLSLPKLKRAYFNQKVKELEKEGYIIVDEGGRAIVTPEGAVAVKGAFQGDAFPSNMNGLVYGDQTILFWRKLSLLIQVISNGKQQETLYFPVQRNKNIQDWVKGCLKANPNIENLSSALYKELHSLLTMLSQTLDPTIFVFRLTGYKDYGWTELQVAEKLNMHQEEFRFQFLNLIHGMLSIVEKECSTYPILFSISLKSDQQQNLTISTSKTYELYQRGHTIEEISRIRELKINTIEDHVIELILTQKEFDIEPFISQEEYQNVLMVMKETQTKRLKPIKEKLPHLSYFQIRVTIAKAGENGEVAGRA
ncbi:helix-turn-helix domain-containing protein [Rossellomorea aquimaris]|uniref:helix-turn-helix domain-containing protein n=1 Tax=Rossellomorea aquimaris TaxID=189382 RepID=UPI00069774EA|nr:helix-turn-helix domain-containing protein [Rossellomorea aquimaris]